MAKRLLMLLSIFLLTSIICINGEPPAANETKVLAEKIMATFKEEKFDEAFDLFKGKCQIPEAELDKLKATIKKQWDEIIRKGYGEPVSIELAKEERIGKSFVKYMFLHKFQNTALVWTIVFYKPQETWFVNALSYDGKLEPLYKQQ